MKFESLVIETKKLVDEEKVLSAEIIHNLGILYQNQVHTARGYDSFFKFCTERLGMCEATAQRKIDAVKLSFVVLDLPQRIESGAISLNKISLVSQFMRDEKREAGREFKTKEVLKLVEQVQEQKSTQKTKQFLATQSQVEVKQAQDPIKYENGTGHTRLDFEVDEECTELLERVRQLRSHHGNESLNEVLKVVLKNYLKKHDPAQRGVKNVNQVEITPSLLSRGSDKPSHERSRHIPKEIYDLVWNRCNGKCTYEDFATKKVCGSTFRPQVEHIIPFSQGGTHDSSNLTIHCQAHNLYNAKQKGLLDHQPRLL